MGSTPPATSPSAAGAPTQTLRVVRGGVGIGAVVTGALVVSAAAALFTSLAIAISSYVGYKPYRLPLGGTRQVGLTVAVAVGLGLLVAFMWGGYAAGRMARGAGWLNGFLVAVVVALMLAAGLAMLVVLRPGPGLNLHLPSGFPKVTYLVPKWIDALAAAAIALAGAALGGALGARWHGRLERLALKQEQESREARESFRDLREATAPPAEAAVPAPAVTVPMGPVPVAAKPPTPQADRETEAGAGFVQDVEPAR